MKSPIAGDFCIIKKAGYVYPACICVLESSIWIDKV